MKIHLDEPEIHEAIKMYVESQGFSLKNREVDIEMTAGRNPTRIFADISINRLGDNDVPETLDRAAVNAAKESAAEDNNLFGDDD